MQEIVSQLNCINSDHNYDKCRYVDDNRGTVKIVPVKWFSPDFLLWVSSEDISDFLYVWGL